MSEWAVKRFWQTATIAQSGTGFAVRLDDRPLRTPAKSLLVVPTEIMARAAAAEWDAQAEKIDPATMPVTRSANAAIDKVTVQFDEVVGMLAEYGATDLTCYRAEGPQALVDRQAAGWDPLLEWTADRFGARLIPVEGVIHQPQNPDSLARMRKPLDEMTPFELTAMHDLVSLSGSLVIGLAVKHGNWRPETLWECSRIDEDWQAEKWGQDDEAGVQAEKKRQDFLHAADFLDLARDETGADNA